MNLFEELVRAEQPKRRKYPVMSLDQISAAILKIVSKDTALQFKIDYIAFSKSFWHDRYDPYQIVNEAIAASFDKMTPKQIKMWNELGVKTPPRRVPPKRY